MWPQNAYTFGGEHYASSADGHRFVLLRRIRRVVEIRRSLAVSFRDLSTCLLISGGIIPYAKHGKQGTQISLDEEPVFLDAVANLNFSQHSWPRMFRISRIPSRYAMAAGRVHVGRGAVHEL